MNIVMLYAQPPKSHLDNSTPPPVLTQTKHKILKVMLTGAFKAIVNKLF